MKLYWITSIIISLSLFTYNTIGQTIIFTNEKEASLTLNPSDAPFPYLYSEIVFVDSTNAYYIVIRDDYKLQGLLIDKTTHQVVDSTNALNWSNPNDATSNIWSDASNYGCLITGRQGTAYWHFADSELQLMTSESVTGNVKGQYLSYNIADQPFPGSSTLYIDNLLDGSTESYIFGIYKPVLIDGYSDATPFVQDQTFDKIIDLRSNDIIHDAASTNRNLVPICNDSLLLVGENDRITVYNHIRGTEEVLFGFSNTNWPQIPLIANDGTIQVLTTRDDKPQIRYYDQSLNLIRSDVLDFTDIYYNRFIDPEKETITIANRTGRLRAIYDLRHQRWYEPTTYPQRLEVEYPYVTDQYIYSRINDTSFLRQIRGTAMRDTVVVEVSIDKQINSTISGKRISVVVWQGINKGYYSLTPESAPIRHFSEGRTPFKRAKDNLPNQVLYHSTDNIVGYGDYDIVIESNNDDPIRQVQASDQYLTWLAGDTLHQLDLSTNQESKAKAIEIKGLSTDGNTYFVEAAVLYSLSGETVNQVRTDNNQAVNSFGNVLSDQRASFYSLSSTLYTLEASQATPLATVNDLIYQEDNGCGLRTWQSLIDYDNGEEVRCETSGRFDEDNCIYAYRDTLYKYPIGRPSSSTFYKTLDSRLSYSDYLLLDRRDRLTAISPRRVVRYNGNGQISDFISTVHFFDPTDPTERYDHLYYLTGESGFFRLFQLNCQRDRSIDVSPPTRLAFNIEQNSHIGEQPTETWLQVDSILFFVASTTANGEELWYTDGTETGTQILFDPTGDVLSSRPGELQYDKGRHTLYWTAKTEVGNVLYSYRLTTSTSIKEKESQNLTKLIHPNPASDVLLIDEELDIKEIHIYDQQGRMVLRSTNELKHLDIQELHPGWYAIRVLTTDNEIISDRFIKM